MKYITKSTRVWMKLRMLLIPEGPDGDRQRGKLYEPYLKRVGRNFKVASNAFIFNPNGLSVGDNVYIGFNSYLGQGEIILDDEVLLGNFVSITASNHLIKNGSFRFGGFKAATVEIGKGSWLGAHASIMAGVKLGPSSLVAAGSVVTKSFEGEVVLGGVPAKVINSIDNFIKKNNV